MFNQAQPIRSHLSPLQKYRSQFVSWQVVLFTLVIVIATTAGIGLMYDSADNSRESQVLAIEIIGDANLLKMLEEKYVTLAARSGSGRASSSRAAPRRTRAPTTVTPASCSRPGSPRWWELVSPSCGGETGVSGRC